MSSRKGFTLIEVLLSLMLASGVMTAMMLMVSSMSDIWQGSTPVRYLEVHSRQVKDFIKQSFSRALLVESDGPVYVFLDRTSGDFSSNSPPLLSWEVQEGDGIILQGEKSLPYLIYQLEVVDDVGLVLYYQSRLEVEFEETPPRQFLLSEFVTRIQYHYYDGENEGWDLSSLPRENLQRKYEIPDRIQVFFKAEDEEIDFMINLPQAGRGVPVF